MSETHMYREIAHLESVIAKKDAEIAKLRETREYWPHNAEADAVIKYQEKEIEKLRSDLRTAVFADSEMCKLLEADNERLLAALTLIRDAGPMTVDDQRWKIARDALEGKHD